MDSSQIQMHIQGKPIRVQKRIQIRVHLTSSEVWGEYRLNTDISVAL